MHEMSEEIQHEVKPISALVRIVRHARFVYDCRDCEKTGITVPIKTAKAPRSVIEKGVSITPAEPGALGCEPLEAAKRGR
jgi:hypothetical protein